MPRRPVGRPAIGDSVPSPASVALNPAADKPSPGPWQAAMTSSMGCRVAAPATASAAVWPALRQPAPPSSASRAGAFSAASSGGSAAAAQRSSVSGRSAWQYPQSRKTADVVVPRHSAQQPAAAALQCLFAVHVQIRERLLPVQLGCQRALRQ